MASPRTIRSKLTRVVMATTASSLLLATVALLVDEYVSHRSDTSNRLRMTARIAATLSSAAVLFKDARAAEEILSSLRADEDLVAAAIYTLDGHLFVHYPRGDDPPGDLPSEPSTGRTGFHWGSFEVFETIAVDRKPVGTFYLRSDLRRLRARMAWNSAIAVFALAASAGMAMFLATRLLSHVTEPILRLEHLANRVTVERDYAVRATPQSDDEVGSLVRAFNEMLAQIEMRDDAIRKAHAELEERVEARTIALQTTLRELESFTYTISHDLRAPLRALAGFSRMLLEDFAARLGPVGCEYLAKISVAAKKMDALILDLLDYSRVTRQDVKIEPVDLDALVAETVRLLETEIREREAEIIVEKPLPRVLGHALTLGQTLTNLLSNAMKFVAPGVLPRVRVRAVPQEGMVRVEVEDNGIGIAPEYQERIFRIFERLNPIERYPGTGIGLAIVRRAMERMGGRSGVESEPDRGSCFWIELPAAPSTFQ